jgi:hypothetical protein
MTPTRIIYIKRIVIGFAISTPAVAATTWSLVTYVPNVPPAAIAVGAWFATFYPMMLIVRSAVRDAHRAGEVERRLPALRRVRAMVRNRTDVDALEGSPSDRTSKMRDESLVTTSVGD